MKRLKNNGAKILVVGDLMIDHYLWGKTNRISPEAPVPVVEIEKETSVLGGAGNVINNLLSLEAQVGVISVIGDDDNGKELIEKLIKAKVNTGGVLHSSHRKTSKKTRIVAAHHQMIRFDKESKEPLHPSFEEKIIELLKNEIKNYDGVLLSDYNKGVLTHKVTQTAILESKKANIPVLVDPKGVDYTKYKGATLLTPNKKEAELATNIKITDDNSLKEAGFFLKKEYELDYSMITLSEDGIGIFDKNLVKIKAEAKEVFDVTGAGDTVLATLGIALALKMDLVEAAKLANLAAAVVVGKIGSATVTPEEISAHKSTSTHSHNLDIKEIETVVSKLKKEHKKIVFTNGCFDILHIGHIEYLQKSKAQGDILIVGLNSDDSVKTLKGESRPINNQEDRALMLLALSCVDYVVVFDEETPYNLIKTITPHILTKGADYEGKEVVGSDIANEVCLIDFVDGRSTTNIITKIKGK